jgi:hypothetical protein
MDMTVAPPGPRLPAETVMAQVDGQTITAGDIDAALANAPGEVRYEYTTPAAVTEFVESLVDRRLMAAAARKAGLAASPEVKERLNAREPGAPPADYVLADAWLQRELAKLPAPTEAEVMHYYQEQRAAFTEPHRVFVTRVVADSNESASKIRAALSDNMTLDELKERHGQQMVSLDQVWLQDVPKAPELTSIALKLKPGGVSSAIPTGDGVAVLRVEREEADRLRSLDEVRAGIRATLEAEMQKNAVATLTQKLRKDVRVKLNDEAIKSYSGATPDASPPPTRDLQSN